jgi:hypothetical protein
MKDTVLSARLEKAFIDSSTDEVHHTQYDDVELDKVALATNRIYMLDVLRPRLSTGVVVFDLEKQPSDRGVTNPIDRLYASYFFHCVSHFVWSDFMRGLYVLKGMAEKLDSKAGDDYIDKVDNTLARRLENVAYLDQIASPYTPNEISTSLAAYVPDGPGDISHVSLKNCKDKNLHELWISNMRAMLNSRDACLGCRYKFLGEEVFPVISELMRLDKHNTLSEFTFGIMSMFLDLPPQQYFASSLDGLENSRLGFCPVRICGRTRYESLGYGPVVTPSLQELYCSGTLGPTDPFSLHKQFEDYPPIHEGSLYSDPFHYKDSLHAAISYAIRYVLHYIWSNCPCPHDLRTQRVNRCPMELPAYKTMKRIFTEHAPDFWISLRDRY